MKRVSKKYNLDNFTSGHFFEDFQEKDSFYFKKFFGGLSIYLYGKMVAFLCDNPGDKSYRGVKYKFEIWDGCLIPSERARHAKLLKLIKGSIVHPVIEKWLYLPKESKNFESSMLTLVDLIKKKNELVGIEPKLKLKSENTVK